MSILAEQIGLLADTAPIECRGTVVEVRGLAVRVADLPAPVGATVRIQTLGGRGAVVEGQVIGVQEEACIVMPIGATVGICRGDRVVAGQYVQMLSAGEGLLGRVLDGMGRPIDRLGPLTDTVPRPLYARVIDPLDRPLIDTPLATGIRAIDALISVGRGQRLGVFAAPGVGKSVLLGMMTRATAADVCVLALVGERGREVRDFIENQLGVEGLRKSVVVCATGDEPPLLRLRAAMTAAAVAEYFRDQGKDVLLIMDSVTRFCQAQRQIGLAAGEPPATKGYPPSVFTMLPVLLERSGRTSRGSITGFYAVLVEGDDMNDPVADAARSVLDGHILLSRHLAHRGHWPAIDAVESISRVCDAVIDAQHQAARREVLRLISSYSQVEDLLNIGAYAAGSNPDFDLAIAAKGAIDNLLQQGMSERQTGDFARTRKQLLALTEQIKHVRQQVSESRGRNLTPARTG